MKFEIEQAVDGLLEQDFDRLDTGDRPPPPPPPPWPEIDTSTPETWADGLIQKIKHAAQYGLGLLRGGEEYGVKDFMADTLIGDFPWDSEADSDRVLELMKQHPEYEEVRRMFELRFGVDFFKGLDTPINEL